MRALRPRRLNALKEVLSMELHIFRQLCEWFGIFMLSDIFVPFFSAGAVAIVSIRLIGKIINKGWKV